MLEKFKDYTPRGGFKHLKRLDRLSEIIEDYEKWRAKVYYIDDILQIPKPRSYSARDVHRFSKYPYEVKDREFIHSGVFLSLLVNESMDSEFELELGERINYLGRENRKKIVIKGDAGSYLGYYMQSGEIILEGSAGDRAGSCMNGGRIIIKGEAGSWLGESMQSGEIIVEGNAGAGVGFNMSSGRIIIKGDVSHSLGYNMRGGEIIIEGNAGASVGGNMLGGEIWVKGRIQSIGSVRSGEIYEGREKEKGGRESRRTLRREGF
jgi:glutamate synthase domain-containing protein 3